MKLGIGSYTYTWACGVPGHLPEHRLTALGLCHRAVELGVGVVQCCENFPFLRSEWGAVREFAGEHGLQLEIGTRGLLGTYLEEAWTAADYFGSPFIRLVLDRDGHEPTADEAGHLLRPWVERCRTGGRQIAIENHDRFPVRILASMIENLGPDAIGVTLDTVNSFAAMEAPEMVVQHLAPHTISLHVKDFVIRRVPSMMGFVIEGCPAGDGRLDIPWLLDCLRAAGRDPNAILELWTPLAGTMEETIARETAWAEKSIAKLRQFIAS